MSKAPDKCLYCGGKGYRSVGDQLEECGFCDNGSPLDSQRDWDKSWGNLPNQIDKIFKNFDPKRKED